MKVYMYMGIFADNPEPDIKLFSDKDSCMKFLNSEIDSYCTNYHLHREDFDIGLNTWHHDYNESTFIFREMEVHEDKKIVKDRSRFFRDLEFMEEVQLTDEEWDFFDITEWDICGQNGYQKLSGGHCQISIVDREDKSTDGDGLLLHIEIMLGVEGYHLSHYGDAVFDRQTRQLVEE